ncbi:MAG: hypothetical protein J5760_00020, partial [Clostridia bacterium]|nr:hypothetical protein [Clostridia bacterium]
MKKLLALILAAILVFTAAAVLVTAEDSEPNERGFNITPSCSETNPLGGGSKDVYTMIDGDYNQACANGGQYDTYTGSHSDNAWFALTFDHNVHVTGIEFTEGNHYDDGGWFTETPSVQIFKDGAWTDVGSSCSPAYGEHGSSATFTFTLTEAVWCEGIRVTGTPGGYDTFVGCSELVPLYDDIEDPTYPEIAPNERGFNITPACSVRNPLGGGSKDIATITDGDYNEAGANDGQYDTYTGSATTNAWFALTFDHTVHVTGVEFTEGLHYDNGGWFDPAPSVQVLKAGVWTDAASTCDPAYGEHGSTATFTFTLTEAEWCEGVRVTGTPGGYAAFVGCTELVALYDDIEDPTYPEGYVPDESDESNGPDESEPEEESSEPEEPSE